MAEFVLNGKIYSVGGEGPGSGWFTNTVYRYNPGTNSWETLNSFPYHNVWDAEGVVCNGSAYILGGRRSYGRSYPDVYMYNESTDSWTKKTDMPYHVLMHCAVSYNGEIWVFGGYHFISESTHVPSNKVQVYNPSTNSWRYEADMPCTLGWARGVIYEGSLWLFSNSEITPAGAGICEHVYQYDFATGVWTVHDFEISEYMGFSNPLGLIGDKVYLTASSDGDAYQVSLSDALTYNVLVDIKPGSCPNPLNVKDKGVLPVAILGTEDFDVSTIDPASVRLEDIAPIRSSFEDVSTPVFDKLNVCDCTDAGPDGYIDLVLKFNVQDIVAALGEVTDGDELELILTGALAEAFDGIPIEGSDCVVIIKKDKK